MRTTIDLPDQLFRRVKAKAAMEGTSLKGLITHYIEQGLGDRSQAPRPNLPVRSSPPLIRPATGRPILPLTNAEIDALVDQEDTERIGRD